MFDFLKGGKVDLSITLDRPGYFPGDTVRATISVQNQKEIVVREGRAALLRREEYEYEYADEDDEGNSQTKTGRNTQDDEAARLVLLSEGTLRAGAHTFEFAARLPEDAAPTWAGGKVVKLRWFVKVVLDRKLGLDWSHEVEALVLQTPPGQQASAGEFGQSEAEDVELKFALPGKEYVLGGTIAGQLLLRPKKNGDLGEVKLQLRRVEEVKCSIGHASEISEAEVKLASKVKLQAGQPQALPFRVAIPAGRPTTGQTTNSVVAWQLRAVLARGFLRSDYTVETEIGVYPTKSR
jgi:hypothetical protein